MPDILIFKVEVIEWCTHHRDDPTTQDDQERRNTDIEEWDQKYMEVDQETLFDIILVRRRHILVYETKKTDTPLFRLPITSILSLFLMLDVRLLPT